MSKKEKVKKQYPEDLRSLLGFSLPNILLAFSTVIYGMFMQYLTDYSGIDAAIGIAGYAAGFGTIFLIVSRIIDALDDPIQAWFMDSAKERPFGKYRLYTMCGIFLLATGMIAMFSIPDFVKSNKVLLAVWVFFWYLMFDMGSAFNGIMAILQKATTDFKVRTKVMTWYRMFLILGGIPAAFFVPIATVMNAKYNDMGTSVSVTCRIVIVVAMLISLIGIALLRERYIPEADEQTEETKNEKPEKVSAKDVLFLLKTNKAMWVHNIAYVIGNSAYGFAGTMSAYFLKWYFCADQATGVVNNEYYGAVNGTYGLLNIIGTLTAPLVASWFTKKMGSVDRSGRTCMLASGIGYLVMFVFYLTGIMKISPFVYIILYFLVSLPTSMATIPFLLLNVEVADYSEYKTGRNMTQITNSVMNIISKTSTALTTAIIGALLVAFHYTVDSVSGNYAGDVSQIPSMINSFALFVTIVPAACCLVCWIIYKKFYPITPEIREAMTAELKKKHEAANAESSN